MRHHPSTAPAGAPHRHGSRNERPFQTGQRLCDHHGVAAAVDVARNRVQLHAPVRLTSDDLADPERLAAIETHNAKRSVESFNHWREVLIWVMGRVPDPDRRRLGLRPRRQPDQPTSNPPLGRRR
ncbi:MAG: hypothetical protein RJA36_1500 [Pseudomonadota bacterium]